MAAEIGREGLFLFLVKWKKRISCFYNDGKDAAARENFNVRGERISDR